MTSGGGRCACARRVLRSRRLSWVPLIGIAFVALSFAAGCGLLPFNRLTAEVEVSPACVPSGPYRLTDYFGGKQAEGRYDRGRRAGVWRFWDSEGILIVESSYEDGVREGPYRMWYGSFAFPTAAGKRKVIGAFVGDQLDGRHTSWTPEGRPVCVANLRAGEVVTAACWKASGGKYTKSEAMDLARGLRAADIDYLHQLDRAVDRSLEELCGGSRSGRALASEVLRE